MQAEDDRDRGPSGPPDIQAPMADTDAGVTGVRNQLVALMARMTKVESDLAALRTGMSIVETRLTGIENRQRHTEDRRRRIETRFSDFDSDMDRVRSDTATLKDRVRCVELDLRELSGVSCRGPDHGAPGPLSHAVSGCVGFKSS